MARWRRRHRVSGFKAALRGCEAAEQDHAEIDDPLPRPDPVVPRQLATVLLILVAGKWFDWWRGVTWGYRSIVDAASFLALLMVPIVDRIVASLPLRLVCGV